MSPTVYLVSGANRSIGLGLVTQLTTCDNVVIFAGARNPSAAEDLKALVHKYPGKFHVVKLVLGDKAGNKAAVAEIKQLVGRLVVIANAGAYGVSKAAENYLAHKIHTEYLNFVCFIIHPGGVKTDMVDDLLKYDKSLEPMVENMIAIKESAAKILIQVDKAIRETASGRYLSYTGQTLNW